MKFSALIFLLISFFAASLAEIETEDAVLVLTKDNIDEAIAQYDYLLLEFYAPWCKHCKDLAPEYAKAAKKLQEINSPVKLAKIDATVETELAEKHNVNGYPTLKFVRRGLFIQYTGTRNADDIVYWVTLKIGPPAKDLTTVDEAKSFLEAHNVAIVGFFKDQESDDAKEFINAASLNGDYAFGITSNEEVVKEYDTEYGKVILFKKFDDGKDEFTGELTAEALQNFIYVYSLPLVVEFNQTTASKIFRGHIKHHLLLCLNKEAGHYDKYVDMMKEPAKTFRGKVLFVTVDTVEADHERILEYFGLKKSEVPAMRIIELEKSIIKYKPEKPELSTENVVEFVNAFLDNKLKQHLITQDLPEDWDKNPVKVLVGTNFHEVAHDPKKNVLVEFYAPWCTHCQELAPVYEALGEKYKDSEDILIAKVDGTANEFEDIEIAGFPTIILYKKETNEPLTYYGERTFEGLSKFLETNGAESEVPQEVLEEDEDDDVPRKDEL
ncbi:protein disulfide isomerase [Megalopta genalis]|uniref:protein disulfide isomerase n=1 Tax=Megalopta genalis TaxID=115081 RepID=UPI00144364AC|nr:protein disulfide-isomerase [Megalopta genalis]XP_033330378.1 protein disulfide-isomerase [Megalopta genalis]